MTVVSILKPNQKWANYNLKISSELKISLGNTALIASIDPEWLVRAHKDIHALLRNCYYVNYGSSSPAISKFFAELQAIPISKDINGNPKLQKLYSQVLSQTKRNFV